jgi:NAD(P)-dependent dehydrogenase (short-subunit alcohol dehydrogenase family)
MQISGSVALVTGANRGLGLAFSRELVRRGAAKVYGAARSPGAVTEPGVVPVGLDITDGDQVERVAAQLPADPISIPPPQAMHLVCNRACWHGSRNTRGEAGRLPSWRRLSSATPAGRTSSWPPSCTVFTSGYASWKLSWPG